MVVTGNQAGMVSVAQESTLRGAGSERRLQNQYLGSLNGTKALGKVDEVDEEL